MPSKDNIFLGNFKLSKPDLAMAESFYAIFKAELHLLHSLFFQLVFFLTKFSLDIFLPSTLKKSVITKEFIYLPRLSISIILQQRRNQNIVLVCG
jgi:hypothetical protein